MPIVSQAQRGAMYAAKAGKSTLGIPKSVGKEFVSSDTGGKLPKTVNSRSTQMYSGKKTTGFAEGGKVDTSDLDPRDPSFDRFLRNNPDKATLNSEELEKAYKSRNAPAADTGKAKGGKVKSVSGKPVGKDDGYIPAQRGEYVVRKSAVKKLGTAVMNQVNKGKLPSYRLYGHGS